MALSLCSNLPSHFRQLPFWEGIETAPAGHLVRIRAGHVAISPEWNVEPVSGLSQEDAATRLRSLLLNAVQLISTQRGKVSSDVSGGIDSTTLAFFLRQIVEQPILYHAGTDDPQNGDTHYARRAAAEIGGDYIELASFSHSIDAFTAAADASLRLSGDGPLSWRSNAVHLAGLVAHAASRGVQAHMVGLGGDELFSVLPAHPLALQRNAPWFRSNAAVRRMAKTQRWGRAATHRAATSKETLSEELLRRVRARGDHDDEPSEAFGWAPGFANSPFASELASDLVAAEVRSLVENGVEPHFQDKFRHQIAESVKFQGEVIRQMNYAFRDSGVAIMAPLLDDGVLSFVLGLPPELTTEGASSKPLLAAAGRNIVPPWIHTRPDKGEYSKDLFANFTNHREDLRKLFRDSYLVDHHYVDPDRVMAALDAPLLDSQQLFDLEHLASVEYWLRRVA